MASASTYRALVVEDEVVAREAAVLALQDEGFHCEWACDGNGAAELLKRSAFDVVVTDLRMPKRHGHALAVDLLGRGPDRPLVVVLTGMSEPRLAKDLIARGVDDVAFKPVNLNLFAAKVGALCARRNRQRAIIGAAPAESHAALQSSRFDLVPVTTEQIEQRLDSLMDALPVSQAAIEVVNLIQDGAPSIAEVARSIARDPLLTVEVLRLANSGHHNPAGKRIDSLQEAIARVGDRQISELALASTTIRALSQSAIPWIDPDLLWQRSLAASLVIEQLHPAADAGADEEGLFLSSLLLPISRVLLGLAFPDLYQRMVAQCQETGCSLASLERQVLLLSPPRALAGMLARWHLSPRLVKSLQQSGLPYHDLSTLTEPLRSKVERLRMAELMGQLAAGRFDSWDEIDFPPSETMRRIRAHDLAPMVEQVRTDLAERPGSTPGRESVRDAAPILGQRDDVELRYFKLAVDSYDLPAMLLQSLNVPTLRISRSAACEGQPALVNCLDVSDERQEWFLEDALPDSGRTLIRNAPLPAHCECWGKVVQLPVSFKVLSDAIRAAAPHS